MAIVATPGICGGLARVDGHRVAVWQVERARRLGADLSVAYPTLSADEIAAAIDYAGKNKKELARYIKPVRRHH